MELMPGYKISEAGVIPEDWESRPLSSIGRFKNGINKGSEAFGHGSPFVNLMDVFGVNSIKSCDGLGLVKTSDAEQETYDLKLGDVIFIRSSVKPSGVGLTAVVEADLPKTVYSGFLIRFRDGNALDIAFKKHCFYSEKFRSNLIAASTVSANTNINQDNLKKLFIALPPTTAEQRAIAQALSDIDALLATLDQVIAKKRDLKQATMQQLLTGKTRLPGFSGEWEVKRLGDICELKMGRTPPRLNPAFWGEGYVWLSIADLQSKLVSSSKEQVTEAAAATMELIPKGTLLMSFKLSIGRLCFAGCDLFTNEAICSFNSLTANADYLYYALERVDFSLYGKQAVKGYTLNKKSLKTVKVTLPTAAEQAAIAKVLSDMDAELSVLESRRDKTRNIKQAMMQELLTGKTRLV